MKKESDIQITRHLLPSQMYYYFFSHHIKIQNSLPTNSTFTFNPLHNQICQKILKYLLKQLK